MNGGVDVYGRNSMRTMRSYSEVWPLHTPFVIARGSRSEAGVVVVEVSQGEVCGYGECTPYARYGESLASVLAQLSEVASRGDAALRRDVLPQLLAPGAARNALDCALWDLECSLAGESLWQACGVEPPASVTTAQTVSIGSPQEMGDAARLLAQRGAALLKIKLDDRAVAERITAVRSAAPQATLIVDANESWSEEGLEARCRFLADLGVAMLEQPLPAGHDAALTHFAHPLPICADESCHTRADLAALRDRYEMVNIKLDKSGGLTEALALSREAERLGFGIMLGCMICTSRAIRAALPLAPAARFVDLDGPTWLARDAQPALNFGCGVIHLSVS